MDVLKRVPVREQDPMERAKNFEEVCYGYNEEEAVAEAERCLNCKNALCMKGCPVSINIPAFIQEVKNRNFEVLTSGGHFSFVSLLSNERNKQKKTKILKTI